MIPYSTKNWYKLSNLQSNKLKSGSKNGTEESLKLSSNVVGDSNDRNTFPYKLLLPNTQVSKYCNPPANDSRANKKLSKMQFHEVEQSGEFLGRGLVPLLKTVFPLIGNVFKTLGKIFLMSWGLTAAASETDAAIHKNMFGSGRRY